MHKIASWSCGALAASLLVAGCAMDMGGGYSTEISATRFHLGQPIARGVIAVEAGDPADVNRFEFDNFAETIGRELTRLGWTVEVPRTGRSEQIAVVRVDQVARPARRGGGTSIGIGVGGGSFGRSGGVGVGVGGNVLVGSNRGQIVATQLSVRILRRSDATVAWEGRAETEARAGSPQAARSAAAARLAPALFRDFPGESGRTIRVR